VLPDPTGNAMTWRETFATSGPRIRILMFGGVGLNPAPVDPVSMAEKGNLGDTPMGGTLPANPVPPTFTVHAEKQPMGANLDRIQIVKGWVDSNGDLNETIEASATWTNDIGAAILTGSWTDADFDPASGAFW
jgi:hypothetical protein